MRAMSAMYISCFLGHFIQPLVCLSVMTITRPISLKDLQSLRNCWVHLFFAKVSPSQLAVVGGQGPNGLERETRIYNFRTQVIKVLTVLTILTDDQLPSFHLSSLHFQTTSQSWLQVWQELTNLPEGRAGHACVATKVLIIANPASKILNKTI